MLLRIASYLIICVPALVYVLVNNVQLTHGEGIAFTFSALIFAAVLVLAFLLKAKVKSGVWFILIGIVFLILHRVAFDFAVAFLLIGSGLLLDEYILRRVYERREKDGK